MVSTASVYDSSSRNASSVVFVAVVVEVVVVVAIVVEVIVVVIVIVEAAVVL